jgi:NIMA (never in mitosis gene a)-related kinase
MMTQPEQEYYRRLKLLGEGSFGKAYLVECRSDKQLYVIKQVDLNKMTEHEKEETYKEAKILEALKHPNIIRFKEVYTTRKKKLSIVMDYADGLFCFSMVKTALTF